MKRAPELAKLSRDHHQGLVQARKLRNAADGEGATPEEAARLFLDFWRTHTRDHFREEEEALLPVMAMYGAEVEQAPLVEMLMDHARIRGLVMRLEREAAGGGARPETLREIGSRLEAHIRLEERVVFPLVEELLPEAGLAEIAGRLGPG